MEITYTFENGIDARFIIGNNPENPIESIDFNYPLDDELQNEILNEFRYKCMPEISQKIANIFGFNIVCTNTETGIAETFKPKGVEFIINLN